MEMIKSTGIFATAIFCCTLSLGMSTTASATTYHSHSSPSWSFGNDWDSPYYGSRHTRRSYRYQDTHGVDWHDHLSRERKSRSWRHDYVHAIHDHHWHKKWWWKKWKKKHDWPHTPSEVPIPGVLPALILALGVGGLLGRKRRRNTPGDAAAVS